MTWRNWKFKGKKKVLPRYFILTHDPCSGRLHNNFVDPKRNGEPCNRKTHPGGMVHLRPMSLSWREGIARHRAKELFGIDLKPGEKAYVTISRVQSMKYLVRKKR